MMRSTKAKALALSIARNFTKLWPYERHFSTEKLTSTGKEHPILTDFALDRIRNFSIIAHVDHGKSTLADRLMEHTGAIQLGQKAQYLDKLQVERERGITVKAQTVSLVHSKGGMDYLLNLIDTPGHVDFSYEVSRSLAACQGAILLVDATQGIQAQTVANFYLAFEQGLDIVPVINKIDMSTANPENVAQQMNDAFGIGTNEALRISAKKGTGIDRVLDSVIESISPPKGQTDGRLRILLFDAYHDEYRGVICLVEIVDGVLEKGMRITSVASGQSYDVSEIGLLCPEPVPSGKLLTGQVGYVMTSGMKSTRAAQIGDTWHQYAVPVDPLPGFAAMKSNVFAGLFPTSSDDYELLQSAMDRLTLNDASVTVKRETSAAMGYGFRCGFLGMLHMDVFCERLSQEHGVDVIVTTPTVPYIITLNNNEERVLENPCDFPLDIRVKSIQEPTVRMTIIVPDTYTGQVMELCTTRRGAMEEHAHLTGERVLFRYLIGLTELAENFFDDLKSLTKGYASLDYQDGGYREAAMRRLDILVNGKSIDAFARIVHKDRIERLGQQLCRKLKEQLDRQQFEVAIQASSNGKIISRETINALRKNVLAKCYGGDITRKKKLLEKQKEGKKRMKSIGTVAVPQETFHEIVRIR